MTDTPYFDALARRMLPHRRMLDFTTGEDGGVAPILMARNPFAFALGPVKMTELTGVDQSLIPASLVTTVPFLVAPTKGYTPGRWPGVKPEALWMPWLWLPERLARPSVTDGMVEPVVVWQARGALELAVSDLFDAQDGWVDVLRTFAALDVDDETDMTRVTAWLHGGADPDLDAIPPTIADQFLPADTTRIGPHQVQPCSQLTRPRTSLGLVKPVLDHCGWPVPACYVA